MKKTAMIAAAIAGMAVFATLGFAAPKDYTYEAAGSQGKVVYSHTKHLEKLNQKCAECHTKIFKMMKGGTAEKITMAAMKEGKFCGACHDGKKAFSVSDAKDCGKCHSAK